MSVQVRVSNGILEGEIVNSEIAGTYNSFKGIPFAAPPVGDLRFKAPQPPMPWEGVRSAKKHGNICPQYNFMTNTFENGDEDCLYLNVYSPDMNPDKPLPVMIWIHGGAFKVGSGNDDLFGPEFLIRNGVILVTINYRLELLGFLCLDTEDVPGNAGMKDQVAAMRWVNENISKFGGDPNNVTIFGQSSGGASVTYHCVSPMTKGLFKRAIAQSGCLSNWWASSFRPRERAVAFARTNGFTSNDDKELYEFFKNLPSQSLARVYVPLYTSEAHNDIAEVQFSVVSEKVFPNVETFFTGDIIDALKNDIHKDLELILGHNENDGVINLLVSWDIHKTIVKSNAFSEYFVPKPLTRYCSINDQLDIGAMAKRYYTKNKALKAGKLDPLEKFYTLDMYKIGIWQCAKYFSDINKLFFYKFKCNSERNLFSKIYAADQHLSNKDFTGHNDELPYIFPIKSIKQKITATSPTFKLITTICKLWTNFAKTGCYQIVPFAVETVEPWVQKAKMILTEPFTQLCSVTSDRNAGDYLDQRFGVWSFKRGNPPSILGTYDFSVD